MGTITDLRGQELKWSPDDEDEIPPTQEEMRNAISELREAETYGEGTEPGNRAAVNLDGYRLVPEKEVAILFGIRTISALRQRVQRGRFPVRPKTHRPLMWSSVELREWFEDGRRRSF